LQLNLSYNGRTSEGIPIIHTGTIQVRAFFWWIQYLHKQTKYFTR
jgi:hypothetical protein